MKENEIHLYHLMLFYFCCTKSQKICAIYEDCAIAANTVLKIKDIPAGLQSLIMTNMLIQSNAGYNLHISYEHCKAFKYMNHYDG